jgi:hypothetical protein
MVISKIWVKAQDYGTLKEDRNTSQQLLVDKSTANSHPAKWFFSLWPKRKKLGLRTGTEVFSPDQTDPIDQK